MYGNVAPIFLPFLNENFTLSKIIFTYCQQNLTLHVTAVQWSSGAKKKPSQFLQPNPDPDGWMFPIQVVTIHDSDVFIPRVFKILILVHRQPAFPSFFIYISLYLLSLKGLCHKIFKKLFEGP